MKTQTETIETSAMKLNQYEWDPQNDVLGNGAFAEVFKAKDNNDHYVALKIYREAVIKGSTGGSFQGKYTLEQEYKKGELLAHTNVIRYLNFDYIVHIDSMQRKASYPVLVMEYADSGSLSGWLKSMMPPTDAEAIKTIREILNGLAYLHEQGIIHRDLKPGNILFKKDRMGNKVVKISDFGISRDALDDKSDRPSTTAGVGTIDYMAPEQLLKKTYGLNGEISNRTDLWAVGVILYRMLTGKMPFGEENKDYENIHEEIITKEPDYSKVPAPYQAAIKACLQKYASSRPADAGAVIKLLDAPLKKQAEKDTNLDDRERTNIIPDPFKDKKKDIPVPPKPSPIGKYVVMTAGLILVLILLVKLWPKGGEEVTDKVLVDESNMEYTYTGTLKNGLPNGSGTTSYQNGFSHSGEFKNGKADGHGTEIYKDKTKYVGDFSNGKREGQGTYTFTTGETYDGSWKSGLREGQGTQTFPGGEKYEGGFSNNLRSGKGTLTFASGNMYKGDFAGGHMSGNGTYYFNADGNYKGDRYEGEFSNGNFNGKGTYYWADGRNYDGLWRDGQRSGAGKMTEKDGSSHTESWLFGKKLNF